jgi:S-DNA-T family DNA segregation ATPase FtsK/SpoIIIE
MLFSTPAWPKPKRIQGCFVSEDEIESVVDHLKSQSEPDYHEEILHLKVSSVGGGVDSGEDDDPLIWEAADIVVTSGLGSTSMLQRRLKVGYARAGRIMDMLEAKGVVGPPDGSKPREVMVDVEELESLKVFEREEAGEL